MVQKNESEIIFFHNPSTVLDIFFMLKKMDLKKSGSNVRKNIRPDPYTPLTGMGVIERIFKLQGAK